MKKFLFYTGAFLVVFLLVKLLMLGTLYFMCPEEKDKLEFYGKNDGKRPKIIILGASNVTFNFDFSKLEQSFPQYNIVGCHYSAPSGFFVALDKLQYLKPSKDDIIILELPHSYYESSTFLPINELKTIHRITKKTILSSFGFNPILASRAFFRINIKDMYNIIKVLANVNKSPQAITRFFLPTRDAQYNKCWTNSENTFTITSTGFEINYIQDLHKSLIKKIEGKVFYRFPALLENDYYINNKRLNYLENNLPFLNSLESSVYERKYMYNQWYHLNKCGAEVNTKLLAAEIKAKLGVRQ
jgi:hypothetical protein